MNKQVKNFTYDELNFEDDPKRIDELTDIVLQNPDFDLQSLVMPFDAHNLSWNNAALILKKLGFHKTKNLIPSLLCWLQDPNWLGSNIIRRELLTFPPSALAPYVENAVKDAIKENDGEWIANLAVFTYKNVLKEEDFKDKTIYLILKQSEKMLWD